MTRLRRSRFDLVFDLQGLMRSGLMLWATRASLRVDSESAREGSLWGCHFLIPETDLSVPAHLRSRHVVDALGLTNFNSELRLGISRPTGTGPAVSSRHWPELQGPEQDWPCTRGELED